MQQLRLLTSLLLFLLIQASLWSQVYMERSVMAASGGGSSSGSLSLSWTLGEPVTETYTAVGLLVTQGFHQEGLVSTGTHTANLPFEVEVYPNPTSLTLYVTAETDKPLLAEIISLDGKVLRTQQLDRPVVHSPIPMAELPAAAYFLVLKSENGSFTSFKIQKL